MNIIADTHTHTIASTHAYSTIQEMVQAAKSMNLYAIAITDHAQNMPGAPKNEEWYFDNLRAVPKVLYGVRVLKGAEANVINEHGELDLHPRLQKNLEWIVASMHEISFAQLPKGIEQFTNAWLSVAENPNVQVIGHSGTPEFAYDYERVIPQFAKNGKLIEINNGSFRFRKESTENCVKIAKLCKKHKARIVVNTDAHFSHAVGKAESTMEMLKDMDFPKELIVNANVQSFQHYLKEQGIALE